MNLAHLFDEHPADRTAIVSKGDRISYGRLRDEVAKTRGVLGSLGLEPGDVVGIVCATNFRFVRAWFGILGAGMVAAPLNPQSPAPEIARELAAVGAKAVISGPAGIAALAELDRSAVPTLEHLLVPAGTELAGSIDLDALREQVTPAPIAEKADDDLAALLFTSGTAGPPKAAMLSHGNLLSNLHQVQSVGGRFSRPDDVSLCVIPLFHVLGLNAILGLAMWAGATLVLMERFDPVSTIETIIEEQVSVLAGPPTMWWALSQIELVAPEALGSLRLAVSGAAALPDRVVHDIAERFGIRIYEGYGLTEASPSVTVAPDDDTPIGSIGRPLQGLEVRLVDSSGDDARPGDPGEIRVRGPNVFAGYLDDPEASAAAVDEDGWLHTGDIAVADDDGYLFIVDRAKDLIIVSGFNVYPAEVERVLAEHPAVAEAAVIGVAHPHSGEAVKAFVVPAPQMVVEEDALIEHCAGELARYKCPSKVDVVDEIPRGLGGKLLRRELIA